VASGTLQILGLAKSFPIDGRQRKVLDHIDLTIEPGEFVSIVGPSGCGKSTLLRLITGLDAEYEGEILLDGSRITGPSLDRGIVFQDHRLFPWMSVEENVGLALINRNLGRKDRDRLVAEHLALVNLTGFGSAYPHQLSGGMAQRAAIARGLVNEPRILLLDEPLGALDALTRLKVRSELERIWLKHRSTMIMVTHDVSEAVHLASRVIVMDALPGRIVDIVDVPFDYPRDRSSPALLKIEDSILSQIMSFEQKGATA
jgi:NitT/TauT family transport system ATP-binding protein/sulfonate transport system ATP-binding protein